MRAIILSAALLAACTASVTPPAAPVAASDPPPWSGTWDCGVTQMTFNEAGWSAAPGEPALRILRTEPAASGATRLIVDGRPPMVVRLDPSGERLEWLSEATGDAFTCTRNAG